MHRISYYLIAIIYIINLIHCNSIKKVHHKHPFPSIKYVNSITIPFNTNFENTKVGGLSGIDYDKENNVYYIISDDRSFYNNARFYTASINISDSGISDVKFKSVSTLKNEKGEFFSNYELNPNLSIDPEDIRYDKKRNTIVWVDEGDRVLSKKDTILKNPTINVADKNGKFISKYEIPEVLFASKNKNGPRRNGVFEGLSFNDNYSLLYTNTEEPLYEDGEKATLTNGTKIRLFCFDVETKKIKKQFFYTIEPIDKEPIPKNEFAINGVSALLYYKENKLFIVERSYSSGVANNSIKLFLCDLNEIQSIDSTTKIPVISKKLVLDFNTLDFTIDNIEGITFGPKIKNGNRSIICLSDNNFSEKQKTQLILFELIEN